MIKIRMTQTTPGSLDGHTTKVFRAGEEYIVCDTPDLMEAALAKGERVITKGLSIAFVSHLQVATLIRERQEPQQPESQLEPSEKTVVEAAPENKAVLTEEEAEAENPEVIEEKAPEEEKKQDDTAPTLRVFQLADELGVKTKKVLKAANKLNIKVTAAASGLTEEEAEKIKKAM